MSEAVRLVRGLFPFVAEPEVTAVASAGTVNYLCRVGTGCAARIPMQGGDAGEVRALLLAEHSAMREFAAMSTVLCPLPVAIGEPSGEYPLPWSVQTWIEGEVATPASVYMILNAGRLAGVIDTGGFGPADPALDLVAAWHMLDLSQRDTVRTNLAIGDLEWMRAAAWAYEQAIGLVWYYAESNPAMSELGRSTLNRLLTDPILGL